MGKGMRPLDELFVTKPSLRGPLWTKYEDSVIRREFPIYVAKVVSELEGMRNKLAVMKRTFRLFPEMEPYDKTPTERMKAKKGKKV